MLCFSVTNDYFVIREWDALQSAWRLPPTNFAATYRCIGSDRPMRGGKTSDIVSAAKSQNRLCPSIHDIEVENYKKISQKKEKTHSR